MAGIFNLFSDINEPVKGHLAKPLSRFNPPLTPTGSLKTLGVSKPKGLSIRSKSDVNISVTPNVNNTLKQSSGSDTGKDTLKPKVTQLNINGRPLSPGRDPLKKKKEVDGSKKPKLHKSHNDHCFKKPLPPHRHVKPQKFPESEQLASYYDFEAELRNSYMGDLDKEFLELLSRKRKLIKPYEDEGFVSDSESLPSPKIPSLSVSMESLDTLSLGDDVPSLPDLDMDLYDDNSAA